MIFTKPKIGQIKSMNWHNYSIFFFVYLYVIMEMTNKRKKNNHIMQKIFLLLLILINSFIRLHAQEGANFEWARNMGRQNEDKEYATAVDNAGNVYTIGKFRGSGDLDPITGVFTLTSNGDIDVFIQKMSNSNYLIKDLDIE